LVELHLKLPLSVADCSDRSGRVGRDRGCEGVAFGLESGPLTS
jgi:hypothetical protein